MGTKIIVLFSGISLLYFLFSRKVRLIGVTVAVVGGEFAALHISCSFRMDGLVCDWLAGYLSLGWGFSKREQRCVVSEREDASVGETWGAGLADKMWVEPKAAARRK